MENTYGRGKLGYKIIKGEDKYNHRFGGSSWKLPICENCVKEIHQIITLDLKDPCLSDILGVTNNELPLISCLNCSSSWANQCFKIDFENKEVSIINVEDNIHEVLEDDICFQVPLKEVSMKLEELSKEERPTDEESFENSIEIFGEKYFCRILGDPLWLEQPLNTKCRNCNDEITYVGMIGSQIWGSEPIIEDQEFYIGEHSLYFSICKKCNLLHVECQGS
ncbi:hypothetical protein [Clostridium sp.]|uniref:hypothetical protein n=1 Tax=Clostridium sp. TaxID=1506 RepID=UPI002FCC8740